MKWLVQNNFLSTSDLNRLEEALKNTNTEYELFSSRAFSKELPPLQGLKPCIVYGSVRCIEAVVEHNSICRTKYYPGVFNREPINWKVWALAYGDNALNNLKNAVPFSLKEQLVLKGTKEYFIRPVDDNKLFGGHIAQAGMIAEWAQSLLNEGFDPEFECILTPPRKICFEWRCFLVKGKVAGASQYSHAGEKSLHPGAPEEVVKFAEKMYTVYAPDDVFVMDVAEMPDGELKIIELNGFNSCGFYEADRESVIRAINEIH